jgi:hypothetical protein
MARAHGHHPFADIAAGGDRHAQPVARVLMHEGPVGALQQPRSGSDISAKTRRRPSRMRNRTEPAEGSSARRRS